MRDNAKFRSTSSRFSSLSSFDGEWNEPLVETEYFVVLPTLGMLVEGWLLIIPKAGHLNFGYLSKPELHDYEELHRFVSQFQLEKYFCRPTVFEHGPARPQTAIGCGVDVAHRHFVPLQFDLVFQAQQEIEGIWEKTAKLDRSLKDLSDARNEYIHINSLGENWVCHRSHFESQLLRKIIATQTGQPEAWDWKTHQFTQAIWSTITAFNEWEKNKLLPA